MPSNRTILDYIVSRRTLEGTLDRARSGLDRARKELKQAEDYVASCQRRLQHHNENPPVLTEKQEAFYGSRVRDQ